MTFIHRMREKLFYVSILNIYNGCCDQIYAFTLLAAGNINYIMLFFRFILCNDVILPLDLRHECSTIQKSTQNGCTILWLISGQIGYHRQL